MHDFGRIFALLTAALNLLGGAGLIAASHQRWAADEPVVIVALWAMAFVNFAVALLTWGDACRCRQHSPHVVDRLAAHRAEWDAWMKKYLGKTEASQCPQPPSP